jgi:hypothetical protein
MLSLFYSTLIAPESIVMSFLWLSFIQIFSFHLKRWHNKISLCKSVIITYFTQDCNSSKPRTSITTVVNDRIRRVYGHRTRRYTVAYDFVCHLIRISFSLVKRANFLLSPSPILSTLLLPLLLSRLLTLILNIQKYLPLIVPMRWI